MNKYTGYYLSGFGSYMAKRGEEEDVLGAAPKEDIDWLREFTYGPFLDIGPDAVRTAKSLYNGNFSEAGANALSLTGNALGALGTAAMVVPIVGTAGGAALKAVGAGTKGLSLAAKGARAVSATSKAQRAMSAAKMEKAFKNGQRAGTFVKAPVPTIMTDAEKALIAQRGARSLRVEKEIAENMASKNPFSKAWGNTTNRFTQRPGEMFASPSNFAKGLVSQTVGKSLGVNRNLNYPKVMNKWWGSAAHSIAADAAYQETRFGLEDISDGMHAERDPKFVERRNELNAQEASGGTAESIETQTGRAPTKDVVSKYTEIFTENEKNKAAIRADKKPLFSGWNGATPPSPATQFKELHKRVQQLP